MTALMTDFGHGVLTCNHSTSARYDKECDATFNGLPGESVQDAEARSRAHGWATVTAFGSVANLCPRHT